MQTASEPTLRELRELAVRYMAPHRWSLLGLILFNALLAWMGPLRQISVSPALNILTGSFPAPAGSLGEVSLNNIGPTLVHVLGLDMQRPLQVMLAVVGLYIGMTVVQALLDIIGFRYMMRVRLGVLRDMLGAATRHLLSLPLSYFLNRRAGELVSRLTHDVAFVANSLDALIRGIIQSLLMIAVYLLMLFRTDPLLGGGIVLIGCFHLGLSSLLGRPARERTHQAQGKLAGLTHRLVEMMQGMRVIKSFAAERYMDSQNREAVDEFCRSASRQRTILYIDQPIRLVINSFIIGLAVIACYYSYSLGRLSAEGFGLFLLLCMQLVVPLGELSRRMIELDSIRGGARRLLEMLRERSTLEDGPDTPQPLRDGIELRDIAFHFPAGAFQLRGINLRIRRGEMVAVVGPSGSGKSTLVDLILRLYDVEQGAVLYDGRDVRAFQQRPYRRLFGVVAQESLLFNGTISENVTFNRKPDRDAILRALDVANARRFVEKFPDGLETRVGDRGVRLSGGERQRIAIARAVYENPSVLILDEATSALDSESEAAVQEAIDRVTRNITTIVIAHRLSTIQHADKVVVMKDGGIEAVGRHEELLQSSPTYQRLHALQFRGEAGRTEQLPS
ncbi:MAG TPA: ABC transporter ATP-binding protein [Kiritimatiellia bacterium]|nr:ABC transporter ATP-binding protein [Kiritimatiellia bacterium]